MTYAELLDTIISDSRLSLRQVARKCGDLGVSVTPSYISQLRNGKLPAANPEVSSAIARVCGSRMQAALVFLGYMEKAPEIIKNYMNTSTQLYKLMLESLCDGQTNLPLTEEARAFIKNLDVISAFELTSKYLEEGKFGFTREMAEEMILISGGAVKNSDDAIHTFANDKAMHPIIPVHSMVTVMPVRPATIKEKDIIAFYPKGRRMITLRRVFFITGQVLLIPEDTSYEIVAVENLEEIEYMGKVISYKVDL